MKTPDFPVDEAERVSTLEALDIVYTPSEERFDRITYGRDFAEASVLFNNVLKVFPADQASRLYMERSAQLMVNKPPIRWNGVEVYDIK